MEKAIKLFTAIGVVLTAIGKMLEQVNLYQSNHKTVSSTTESMGSGRESDHVTV